MDLKMKALSAEMKAMEERRIADMKALKTELALEIQIAEERLRGETRLLKWGIVLILAFVVPTFVGAFSPQFGASLSAASFRFGRRPKHNFGFFDVP